MFGKIILSTIIAGMIAGLVLAGVQHFRLTPLIEAAETFESPEAAALSELSKPCVENMPGMKMCGDVARPHVHDESHEHDQSSGPDGTRSFKTAIASMIAGVGFAVLLVGISLLSNIPITKQNGMVWGLCGLIAVAIAPAIGLPPEPPAMPVAELYARQIWWVGTILSTALAIYLIVSRSEIWSKILAVGLIAVPHIIGAPIAEDLTTLVPATLATSFVANSIGAAAVFWTVLGGLLGHLLDKYQKDIASL